jgi:hypothetical protein
VAKVIDPMTKRETPTNCQQEPPYPGAEHVVLMSLRFPDTTAHWPHTDCDIQEPHLIAECGVFGVKGGKGE